MVFSRRSLVLFFSVAGMLLTSSVAQAAPATYLAIGDSWAFGYLSSLPGGTPPIELGGGSAGVQGYVSGFATSLSYLEGNAVNVISTARPGEQTTSYGANASILGVNYNTNYAPFFNTSQQNLVASVISQSQNATIDPIKYVTVQLGGNDLLDIFDPNTFALTGDPNALKAQVKSNVTALLSGLRADLPDARIFLLDYGNPFNGAAFLTPVQKAGFDFIAQTYGNGALQEAAAAVAGVEYVDIYPTFAGQEATLTSINSADLTSPYNFHPNAAGYSAISDTLGAVVVPEAGTLALAGLGIAGVVIGFVRRRKN